MNYDGSSMQNFTDFHKMIRSSRCDQHTVKRLDLHVIYDVKVEMNRRLERNKVTLTDGSFETSSLCASKNIIHTIL